MAREWLKEKRRGNEEIKKEIISAELFGAKEGSFEKTYADELRNELATREEERKGLREMPEYKPLYGALDEGSG